MVEAVPAQGGNSSKRRAQPIPIGVDHLQFKHDAAIQSQLIHNGRQSNPFLIIIYCGGGRSQDGHCCGFDFTILHNDLTNALSCLLGFLAV